MAAWGRRTVMATSMWMCIGRADASLSEMHVCYVLDGILFLYGLILTAFYCKMKFCSARQAGTGKPQQQAVEERIYTGLTPHARDEYETIGLRK